MGTERTSAAPTSTGPNDPAALTPLSRSRRVSASIGMRDADISATPEETLLIGDHHRRRRQFVEAPHDLITRRVGDTESGNQGADAKDGSEDRQHGPPGSGEDPGDCLCGEVAGDIRAGATSATPCGTTRSVMSIPLSGRPEDGRRGRHGSTPGRRGSPPSVSGHRRAARRRDRAWRRPSPSRGCPSAHRRAGERGPGDERSGDGDALPLTTGEPGRHEVHPSAQAHPDERCLRGREHGRPGACRCRSWRA